MYTFLEDALNAASGGATSHANDGNKGDNYGFYDDREELPNGIVTALTKCYVSTCGENELPCYAWSCPRRVRAPGAQRNRKSGVGVGIAGGAEEEEKSEVDEVRHFFSFVGGGRLYVKTPSGALIFILIEFETAGVVEWYRSLDLGVRASERDQSPEVRYPFSFSLPPARLTNLACICLSDNNA